MFPARHAPMTPSLRRTVLFALLAAVGCAASPASAQVYLDVNGASVGFGDYGAAPVWNATNANWTANATGGEATGTWAGVGGVGANTPSTPPA